MNDSPLPNPAWRQIADVAPYVEAVGMGFLIGLGLILVLQIVSVVLQCRALAQSRNKAHGAASTPACYKEANASTAGTKTYRRWVCVRMNAGGNGAHGCCLMFVLGITVFSFAAEPFRLVIPRGLDEFVPISEDNPLTEEKVQLGKRLFFDRALSRDGTVSCRTCHVPAKMFTNRRPVADGVDGRVGRRNVPSLFNRAYQRAFGWDGRETSLEAQVLRPFADPLEMDLSIAELEGKLHGEPADRSGMPPTGFVGQIARFSRETLTRSATGNQRLEDKPLHPGAKSYPAEFHGAFGGPPTAENAAKALASYIRVLNYADSAFDRFQHGDATALSPAAQRGLKVFRGRGNCSACHSGPLFSDEEFHNTGVGWAREPLDLGRFEVTGRDVDRGRFKTPSLRDVTLTAPYMHDGSLATLEDVLEFYSRGGNANPRLDREIRPLNLNAEEKRALVEFLRALTGEP